MKEFKNWRDIQEYFKENGYQLLVDRMEMNNAFWNSCGEFGRSQVYICDSMRFCRTGEERQQTAFELNEYYNHDELHELGIY